jgi:hypothetical protein
MTWVDPPDKRFLDLCRRFPRDSSEHYAAQMLYSAQRYYCRHHSSCYNYQGNLQVITFETYWDPHSAYNDIVCQSVCTNTKEAECWNVVVSRRSHTTAGVYTSIDILLSATIKFDHKEVLDPSVEVRVCSINDPREFFKAW